MRKKKYFCIVKVKYRKILFINNQLLKRAIKILSSTLLALFVLLYVAVALVNYSVVQSIVGSVASDHFSHEWGGKVRIGSLGCNPMNHLVLRNVELIAPDNDTICVAYKMALRFDGFPFDSHGLTFSKVELKDVIYHLAIDSSGTNLNFIINYYADRRNDDEDDEDSPQDFKVLVDDLILDNVCYRQDLKDRRTPEERLASIGVDVPHMEYANIDGRFRNVRVDMDRITCRIDRFSTTERSGLHVNKLRGNVYATSSGISTTNLYLETDDSKLMGDVLLDYSRWKSMGSFLDSVYFTVHFDEGSYGGMQDAAYWAHTLWGMDERVYLQGDFSGPISDFRAENVELAFGDESTVVLDAYIYGLPHIDTTIIGAEIHHLHTTYSDLASVHHPGRIKMKAEKIIKALNHIDLEATFTGTINDFYTTFSLLCDQGDVHGDMLLAKNLKKKEFQYTGQLSSKGFNIGRLAPNEWLSRGGFDLTFEGNGFDPKTMNASAEGQFHHLVVRGQHIIGEVAAEADATDGLLTVDATLDDVLASLTLHGEGDWRGDHPVYRANIDAQHLDIGRLGLWKMDGDSIAMLSFHATARHSNIDDANKYTRIGLNNVHLLTHGDGRDRDLTLKDLSLSSREQNHWMSTTLHSDLADATLKGYYKYSTLPTVLAHIVDDYLPQCLVSKAHSPEAWSLADTRFEFNMEWKDSSALLRSFVPQLKVAQGSTIQANYNYADGLKPIIRSDSIGWGDLCFFDVGLNAEAVADHYRLQMKSDRFMLGRLQLMDFGTLRMETSRSAMSCRVVWQNSSKTVGGGDVSLRLVADSDALQIVVEPSHFAIGGRDWEVLATGDNHLSPRGFHIDKLGLACGGQQLLLTARTEMGEDSLVLNLSNLDMDIANPFIANTGFSIGGQANGTVTHHGVTTGQLNVAQLVFNDVELGNLQISSTLNDSLQQLIVAARSLAPSNDTSFNILLDGYSTLANAKPELHFDADISNLRLAVIQPLVSSFSSHADGNAAASLSLRGTLDAPVVTGLLDIRGGEMNIDFLNVAYSFDDTIVIDRDAVRIDNLVVRDPDGGTAHIDGVIEHNNFNDIRLDIGIKSSQLLCMNTSPKDNANFYGRIVASTDGRVKGPVDNLNVMLNARTLQGTTLNIPINDRRQMEKADYIHFVSDDDVWYDDDLTLYIQEAPTHTNLPQKSNTNENNGGNSSYSLTINVEATPDMQFHMPMEFSTIDVDVKARGNGDLQMSLGTKRGFGIAGDYEISSGTLMLDMLSVASKEFTIDNGSSITFPGNIAGAMFDIRAVLSQRVNLSSLTGTLSSTDSQKPVQVENVIALNGTLRSPDISFDIRLPGADQSVQEEVFSYIDRNNERDMLNQTVSLLLTKRFYNTSASSSQAGSASTGGQAYGFVMGTLGSVISDMVQVVDVNFDYQSGNGLTTDQYAVDISKEWNKFYFETSFGFGGESREVSTSGQGTNNMTGDMLVGYKINPRLHLFVFNRSNTNDYTRSDLPYKQGLGLKYTRDFDRIRELFFWKKRQ